MLSEVSVFWRSLFFVCVLFSAVATATPALARQRVVAQKSASGQLASVYLRYGLQSGHSYQLHVVSRSHVPFTGVGFETYLYVSNKILHSGNKNLSFA